MWNYEVGRVILFGGRRPDARISTRDHADGFARPHKWKWLGVTVCPKTMHLIQVYMWFNFLRKIPANLWSIKFTSQTPGQSYSLLSNCHRAHYDVTVMILHDEQHDPLEYTDNFRNVVQKSALSHLPLDKTIF